MKASPSILYISYDGVSDPLGYSQVFKYLSHLSKDFPIHLMSFEKTGTQTLPLALKEEIQKTSIRWIPLRYHKAPAVPATLFDLTVGFFRAVVLFFTSPYSLVHARSYPATLIAFLLRKFLWRPYIFDMRGFWPDEKIECGAWTKGSLKYKFFKGMERPFLGNASIVVSLTHKGKEILLAQYPFLEDSKIQVIPTCTDLSLYRPVEKKRNPGEFVLGYVGSVLRYRFDRVLDFFKLIEAALPEKDCRLLVLNKDEHDLIRTILKENGLSEQRVKIIAASSKELPTWYSQMSAAIFFADPSYSKSAMSPTKLGELLACGIPCIINEGIGDTADLLRKNRVGVVIRDLEIESLKQGSTELFQLLKEPDLDVRCQQVAQKFYSLSCGVDQYKRIYLSLGGIGHPQAHTALTQLEG